MTAREFDRALKALGWTGLDCSKRLRVRPETVSSWRTGRVEVPGPVEAYLELALKLKTIMEGI